jgi:DNA-binding transcriptional ArsR family regulator
MSGAATAAALDRTFHALADASRRAMIDQLALKPASVSELAKPLALGLPSVVKHLQVLKAAGLVESEKSGRVHTFRMRAGALRGVEAWVQARKRHLHAQFDRLDQLLADEEEPA